MSLKAQRSATTRNKNIASLQHWPGNAIRADDTSSWACRLLTKAYDHLRGDLLPMPGTAPARAQCFYKHGKSQCYRYAIAISLSCFIAWTKQGWELQKLGWRGRPAQCWPCEEDGAHPGAFSCELSDIKVREIVYKIPRRESAVTTWCTRLLPFKGSNRLIWAAPNVSESIIGTSEHSIRHKLKEPSFQEHLIELSS